MSADSRQDHPPPPSARTSVTTIAVALEDRCILKSHTALTTFAAHSGHPIISSRIPNFSKSPRHRTLLPRFGQCIIPPMLFEGGSVCRDNPHRAQRLCLPGPFR